MEEKTLIYVAGNPDAYPLEYFDKDTQTYAGVIPNCWRNFLTKVHMKSYIMRQMAQTTGGASPAEAGRPVFWL